MTQQAVIPAAQQKAPGTQTPTFLLLERRDLLKKFVELQDRIREQESQKQIDLLKDEVALFEDVIPLLQFKIGETSHRPSSRLERANQKAADLEDTNIKLSGRISELQGSTKNEHYQCELLQKKVVELESEKQKQESNITSLEAKIVDLSDRVAKSQADADDEHKKREALQKEHDQLKSDKKTQLQKLELVVQSQESDIENLTAENAALSKETIQARDRAKDANGSVLNAQQVTSMAEDAYIDLQMEKDHDELSRKYGENDAESIAKRFQYMDTIIGDQAAQIHRLEIDLEEMIILQETNQELEKEHRKLKDDGQQWKEASQRTAEDNQKMEEHIQTLEEANQELKHDHRTAKVNAEELKQETQKLKAALEKGNQITVGSNMDDETMKWVLRARDETLKLEHDLGSLEAAWYGPEEAVWHGGEEITRPVSAPPTTQVHGNVQEQDSDSRSFQQSRQSSEIGEPQSMAEAWVRQFASYPPSAGLMSWRNSQSQPGTRPGSRLGYSSIYTPSQRSRPASIIGLSQPLLSARLGLVSRGTDVPSKRQNRHSLQSRRSSITLPRTTSSHVVPTLADLEEKRAKDHFMAYLSHNIEVPFPQIPSPEAPKPPPAAQYHPGTASRDFAVAAADSSQKSLAFYRHNGVKIMEETKIPVRPLHRGRKASLSTISERSGSIFSPRRSESRIRAWLTDDEIRIIRGTSLCERGTQTELEVSATSNLEVDRQSQGQTLSSIVYDHGTQTDSLKPVKAILTYDQETQTVSDDAATAVTDEHFASVISAPVYHSTGTQSSLANVLDPELDLALLEAANTGLVHGENQLTLQHQPLQPKGPQTATVLPESIIDDGTVQDVTPLPKVDKATAMTPKEHTFEHKSVQTIGSVSAVARSMQTDLRNIAELPAPVPTTSELGQVQTNVSASAENMPRTPRSRVAATAQLFEKDNGNQKATRAKLAVLTLGGTQSPASKIPSTTTTPTKLFTDSPHLPFARNDAVTRSLRPSSETKQTESGERRVVQQDPAALRAKETSTNTIDTLPAKAYQEKHSLSDQAPPPTLDAAVQTSPTNDHTIHASVPSPSPVKQFNAQRESTFDATDISSESTTMTWETPDDNPYPTPGFYTNPWRSPITPDYSGLEVVTGASLHDSDKVLVISVQEDSREAETHASVLEELTPTPAEDFARTAMPSPGEIDSDSDGYNEEDVPRIAPDRRPSGDLRQVSALDKSRDNENQPLSEAPTSQVAIPSPMEVPAYEIIPTVKQLTHKSRPSISPVSPEDAWQLQVVKYTEPHSLPSPGPRFNEARIQDDQERLTLLVQRSRTERPVLRSLMLPHAGTPTLLESPIIPFPDFDDQLFESPSEYTHSPYLARRSSRAPGFSETNTTNEDRPAQLWQPPHRPPPLNLLRSGSVAESVSPPIDSPYALDAGKQGKKRFRFQALAALEGMAERPDSAMDYETGAHNSGFSTSSRPNTDRTFADSSARPSPLRFGNRRFPQPEASESGVSEIGATSPTTPKPSRVTFFDKPASSIQQRRHKKAASLPATTVPFIAGLLGWHPPLSKDNLSPTPRVQEETSEKSHSMLREEPQASSTRDRSTNTPTFPGSFRTPQALDPQDFDHLPLPMLPLLFAHLPQLLREAKNVRRHMTMDWGKLWWTVLWLVMAAYFLFNFWLSILLRDHIDDWNSANVSSRKYNHIVMARDEYWGNSWLKLIEFWMAGGLGGSMELFV